MNSLNKKHFNVGDDLNRTNHFHKNFSVYNAHNLETVLYLQIVIIETDGYFNDPFDINLMVFGLQLCRRLSNRLLTQQAGLGQIVVESLFHTLLNALGSLLDAALELNTVHF